MTINPVSGTIYQKLKKYLTLLFVGAIFLHISVLSANAQGKNNLPFRPGEKLTYQGRWGALSAGEATLEVLPMETLAGVKAYHFAMVRETKGIGDLLYKVREREDSYVDADLKHSLLYKKKTEGKHPRDVVINFNWEKREVSRANFGEKMKPISLAPGTFDNLALFYVLRLQNMKENSVIQLPITEGDRTIVAQATVSKREVIQIEGKKYDTFLVIPDIERLEAQDVVKKSDDPQLKIWFTADDRKLPVKIQIRVSVIHLVLELESIEP